MRATPRPHLGFLLGAAIGLGADAVLFAYMRWRDALPILELLGLWSAAVTCALLAPRFRSIATGVIVGSLAPLLLLALYVARYGWGLED